MGDLIKRPFANAGTRTAPPQTDDNFNVNFEQGYTPQYEINLESGNPDARAVERPIMNYLFWLLTSNIQTWQKQGFPEWHSDMPDGYPKMAFVNHDGVIFRSIVEANKAETSVADKWERVMTAAEIKDADMLIRGAIPMPFGGDRGEAGSIIAAPIDFRDQRRATLIIPTTALFNQCSSKPPVVVPAGGVLESLVIADQTGLLTGAQLYVSLKGESWTRAIDASSQAWTEWTSPASVIQVQNDSISGFLVEDSVPGSANAYSGVPNPPLKSYRKGQKFTLSFNSVTANTGPSTISVSGLSNISIKGMDDKDLAAGVILPTSVVEVVLTSLTTCRITSIAVAAKGYQGNVGPIPRAAGFEHSLVPIGFPMPCPATTVPPRYGKLNGQTFSADVYPELAKVYPSLKLPDLRAAAIRGLDDGRAIDINRAILSEQADSFKAHSHPGRTVQAGTHSHGARASTTGEHVHNAYTDEQGYHAHNGSTSSTGNHQHYSGYGENTAFLTPPFGSDGANNHEGTGGGRDFDNSYWLTSANGAHSHDILTTWGGQHTHNVGIGTNGSGHGHVVEVDAAGTHDHTFTTDQVGGTETVMRNVAFLWVCRME